MLRTAQTSNSNGQLNPKATVAGWGSFLQLYQWAHWATLTTRFPDTSPRMVASVFVTRFVRKLAWHAQRPVTWFYALERSSGGLFHLHSLLGGTEALTVDCIRSQWGLGISSVERYDPSQGAPWYAAKELGSQTVEWECYDLSRRFPAMIEGGTERKAAA